MTCWTEREGVMLKAMGHLLRNLKYIQEHEQNGGGIWTHLHQQRYEVAVRMFNAAVHAARKVKAEPDYQKMWEELKKELSELTFGPYRHPCDEMAEIEKRHGGAK